MPLRRALDLVRALSASREGLTIDEMATVLGQTRRSAERTRDLLAGEFELIATRDDEGLKRFRIPDLPRLYTRPNARELAALESEVAALERQGSGQAAPLSSLLEKMRALLREEEWLRVAPDLEALQGYQRSYVGPGPALPCTAEAQAMIVTAMMAGLCLEFTYTRPESEPNWRRVTPCGLLHGPITYLVGTMNEREPVFYRVDRMSEVKLSEHISTLPEDFDLDAWLSHSFGIWREDAFDVQLRILPHAADKGRAWRFHPYQTTDEQDDGSLIIKFSAGGLREMADHLFTWAGDLVIEAPPELQHEMQDRLKLATQMIEPAHTKSETVA